MHLKIDNLELSLDSNQILKNISIECESKKFIGIIGPNGSGKSTLLKCIYRVLKPEKGSIYLDGELLQKISVKNSAKKLSVVAQHNANEFNFSVGEIVLMGRSPYKKLMESNNNKDYEIAKQSLKCVEMLDYINRSFSNLSGGEQQRVILARALAQETPCIILDEPSNHLDIKYQYKILKLIKEMNVTVISAIHDLNIAAKFCDKIYVIENGKIIKTGTPEQVLTSQLIKDVYEIDSEIVRDSLGHMHILYL